MFCPHCGAGLRDSSQFCTECGKGLRSSSEPPGTSAANSSARSRTPLFALIAVAVGALIAAGGFAMLKSDDGGNATADVEAGGTAEPTSTGTSNTPASISSTGQPTPSADSIEDSFLPPDPASIPPVDLPEPADLGEVLLGGMPNYPAAAALTEVFRKDVPDLSGVEIWVWPIAGTDESLLVINVDESLAPDLESDEAVPNLLASPEIDKANVTQLVFNYDGVDDDGPYLLTISIPLAALRAQLAEELGDEELFDLAAIGLRRE